MIPFNEYILKETNYELLSIGNCHKEQFLVNNINIKKHFIILDVLIWVLLREQKKIFLNYLFGETKCYVLEQPMENIF